MYGIKKQKLPVDIKYDEPQVIINPNPDLQAGFQQMSFVKTNEGLQSSNFTTGSAGWKFTNTGNIEANNGNFRGDITGATGTFSGALIAGELHIPDQDTTANSFHADSLGNIWSGATETNKATAPFRVSNVGDLVANNATITGTFTISGGSGIANLSDAGALAVLNTVGTANIDALAVTEAKVASSAIITSKIATGAVTTNEIAANTITASNILAGTITANEMTVAQLSAISADLGTINAGSININSGKAIIDSAGKITATDITVGRRFLTVSTSESIQDAIDLISSTGGRIIVQNGTHSLSADLILYSNVYLEGENAGSAILDFQTNAYGIKIVGSNAYTTGTVEVTNNSTTVTGTSTVWTSAMVGQKIMLGGAWWTIAAVASNTSLSISAPFAGVTLAAGTSYTIATLKEDVKITDLTIKNASQGIKIQYTNEIFFRDTDIQTSVTAIDADDSAQCSMYELDFTANNSGLDMTNCHFFGGDQCGAVDTLAGNGMTLNNVTNTALTSMFMMNSSADGANFTNCSNVKIDGTFLENAGQGLELVSGCSDIAILGSAFESNGSDGIKLTGTTDNLQIIGNSIKNNGGYGINIAASDCDGNNITGNNFAGNTSGAVNDSGTGTLIRGNVGVNDNSTNGSLSDLGLFGDGSDGDVIISTNTTLTADKFYNDLTINTGVTLTTYGYAVYVLGTLTINGTGKIENDGGDGGDGGNASSGIAGIGGIAGIAPGGATFTAGKSGAAGVAGVVGSIGTTTQGNNGVNGTDANPSLGGNGGNGGNGGVDSGGGPPVATTGGVGGIATGENITVKATAFENSDNLSGTETVNNKKLTGNGSTSGTSLSPGASAGSGGSGNTNNESNNTRATGGSGAGGASGGVLFIVASTIVNNGTISADGGNGGNGGNPTNPSNSGFSGGGGGGGGGAVILTYETLTNNGTINASGGIGGVKGTGQGSGGDGVNGTDGTVYKLKISQ